MDIPDHASSPASARFDHFRKSALAICALARQTAERMPDVRDQAPVSEGLVLLEAMDIFYKMSGIAKQQLADRYDLECRVQVGPGTPLAASEARLQAPN